MRKNHRAPWASWVQGVSVVAACVTIAACSSDELSSSVVTDDAVDVPEQAAASAAERSVPNITDFALYADRSIEIGEGAVVLGGHVGVKQKGHGCLLVPGFELGVQPHARVDTDQSLFAASVLLKNGALVGTIHTEHLKNVGATHGDVLPFGAMPALPPASPTSPGKQELVVASGSQMVLESTSLYDIIDVKNKATLRLLGGRFEVGELRLGARARVEVLAAVELRIAREFKSGERSFIGPAPGASVRPCDVRLEVSGVDQSCSSSVGSAIVGEKGEIAGIVLVPKGTLIMRPHVRAQGSFMARDIAVGTGSNIQFVNNCVASCTPASCDDGNPCTADTCSSGTCSHEPETNDTRCDDDNACTQTDRCRAGACVGSDLVVCRALDECHKPGTCNAFSGECSNPVVVDGTGCSDGSACTENDSCQTGVCSGASPVQCDDGNVCTDDSCDPAVGCLSRDNAAPCDDGNACTTADSCSGGACHGDEPVTTDDGNACTVDTCDPVLGAMHANLEDGTPCPDDTVCNGAETCQEGSCRSGQPLTVDDGNPCTADTCDPALGVQFQVVPDGTPCGLSDCTASHVCNSAGVCLQGPPLDGDCGVLPPDPADVAPPLDPAIVPDFAAATEFLYVGDNPIQRGVVPGVIQPRTAVVIRGRVLSREESALPGVEVSILNHPEFGSTLTRADGHFDIATNGGGAIVLRYEKPGLMPSRRTVDTPWRDFVKAPDVVMLSYSEEATVVNLSDSVDYQVAEGELIVDDDGQRQATLVFPPSTKAEMVLQNGERVPLQMGTVRLTEYTVGDAGPRAMPAGLPVSSAYTYAVELSLDEADALGAVRVEFAGEPADPENPSASALPALYVDNFLGFPVGGIVPAGYLDRQLGYWVPADNGRILRVVSIQSGVAQLDVDGDDLVDDDLALSEMGIAPREQQQMAHRFAVGQSFWRVPIAHLTPWDCNWPYGLPDGATGPGGGPGGAGPRPPPPKKPCPRGRSGSIIDCDNQSLGERLDLTGSPFHLHYQSSRAKGSKTIVEVSTGDLDQPGLKRSVIEVLVGGRTYEQVFEPGDQSVAVLEIDDADVYDREVRGGQPVTATVSNTYAARYLEPVERYFAPRAFAALSKTDVALDTDRRQLEITLSKRFSLAPGAGNNSPTPPVAGWSLDIHHTYDPRSRTLYLGDGTVRIPDVMTGLGSVVKTLAGSGRVCRRNEDCGDGGLAVNADLNAWQIARGADGSIYVHELYNTNDEQWPSRIRRIGPDGVVSTIAGPGALDPACADSATDAHFVARDFATGPDGDLFILTFGSDLLKVGPNGGSISVVAGSSRCCWDDADCSEMERPIPLPRNPAAIAVANDGVIYLANEHEVHRLHPDGSLELFADGFSWIQGGISIDRDGTLLVADYSRVWRVLPDGSTVVVAGTGEEPDLECYAPGPTCGDGGPAADAPLDADAVAVDTEGGILIGSRWRVRRVSPDGRISTVIGGGPDEVRCDELGDACGDGQLATRAKFLHGSPSSIVPTPDHDVVFDDTTRLRVASPQLPGYSEWNFFIASSDANEVYEFTPQGRHVRTISARTGLAKYEFRYDGNRLIGVVDADGLVTTIGRDDAGRATAITSPFGQVTTLGVNGDSYLESMTDPGGRTASFTYAGGGLLQTYRDPAGGLHSYEFDRFGRLLADSDPSGGRKVLEGFGPADDRRVRFTSPLGVPTDYRIRSTPTGGQERAKVDAAGRVEKTTIANDGEITVTKPDGTEYKAAFGPDPRFGMTSRVPQTVTITTPAGLQLTRTESRSATLSDPAIPLSLVEEVRKVTVNGRAFTETFNRADRRITRVSPEGRRVDTFLDGNDRVVRIQVPGVAPVAFEYEAGRLVSSRMGEGVTARGVAREYGADGYLRSFVDGLGHETTFNVDLVGQVTRVVAPDSGEVGLSYDLLGAIDSITPPGRPRHSFTYTPLGLIQSYEPPALNEMKWSTEYGYDPDRNPILDVHPDGREIRASYNELGELQKVAAPEGERTFEYDPASGHLVKATTPEGNSLSVTYDGRLPVSETWSGAVAGRVENMHDDNLEVVATKVNGEMAVTFGRDNDGLLVAAGALEIRRDADNGSITGTVLGDVTTSMNYTEFAELDHLEYRFRGEVLYDAAFGRDLAGRITQKTETIGGSTNMYGFVYDLSARLSEVHLNGATLVTYNYDANGNRLLRTTSAEAISGTYDLQDRLVSYGDASYEFLRDGQLSAKVVVPTAERTEFSYDEFGALVSVRLPSGEQLDYVNDPRGRRIGKKRNGTLERGWLYKNQLHILAELDGTNSVVARFVYGSHEHVPDYMLKGGRTYRLVTDHIGSVRAVVDVTSGEVAQRLNYGEFGEVLSDTAPGFQPFGFAGGLYDMDTGLVRFGVRDYDAVTGRWTAKDPIGFAGGLGLFEYGRGDPVNSFDPSGLTPGEEGLIDRFFNPEVRDVTGLNNDYGLLGDHGPLLQPLEHATPLLREYSIWHDGACGWVEERFPEFYRATRFEVLSNAVILGALGAAAYNNGWTIRFGWGWQF